MSLPLPLKADTIRDEIGQILDIIQRWKVRLDEGIPGEEQPSNDINIEIFTYQMRAELMLASSRLACVVEVLEG